uniref:J domain-containing protein n=1 Tax=Polytomella parva TaxID=51329 RepID=A0A7S0UUC3_9CHLO|mmetsp:Transcript_14865/g.26230  ORF Transcript_14865/g.26230 Transcript_14865/m.26230 type:complete len:815 (+) Transcript_14865:103-2547(+)|eukprot:CAMPEP_0175082874 /NCGR_PEP_ID=MMETSP0052_2-20121109/27011_1 /TAXON_ID=51329 ORGANISM="Polytomella parva, Strain SAG 63-3" /NCGR_SAMPLE_ID=MMETSP0052_2 /ASSEMBLY_ACC=CAM_ASM_000194 /LENGTH=814 /DNA_ID=CAMNT_0016354145 /DNA_START=14 /DNA_END=2458 /DNA_ORIENTATION=+
MEEDQESPSYYAVLNVSKEATDEEIRRAYRSLAQVFHPDKHTDDALKKQAQEAFAIIQEAYEILADPVRRQIYDVYGKEGLEAGMEVGEKLNGVEELKKQWEEFKKKQEQQRNDAMTTHRGVFVCRLSASDIPRALKGEAPLFTSLAVHQGIDTQMSDADAALFQGQAVVRRGGAAGGNVVFGYRRTLSPADSMTASMSVGMGTVINVTNTRQLSPYTSVSVIGTWNPQEGPGIGISTTRQLPGAWQSTFGWTLGPPSASGVEFSISKRTPKSLVQAKLTLGSATLVSCRGAYSISDAVSVRGSIKLTVTGPELEVGTQRKWENSGSVGYAGGVVNPQGVVLKMRYGRGEQLFEVPVLLSRHYDDVGALAVAYLLPPVAYYCANRFVLRPLGQWMKKRKERRAFDLHNAEVKLAVAKAEREQTLVHPVAKRKARSALLLNTYPQGSGLNRNKGLGSGAGEVNGDVLRNQLNNIYDSSSNNGNGNGSYGNTGASNETNSSSSSSGETSLIILYAIYGILPEDISTTLNPEEEEEEEEKEMGSGRDGGNREKDQEAGEEEQVAEATSTPIIILAPPSPAAEGEGVEGHGQKHRDNGENGREEVVDKEADKEGGKEGDKDEESENPPLTPPQNASPSSTSPVRHPWMDVTSSLQYLVAGGKLVLHPGVSKSGLMGFCDPAPGMAGKELWIAFKRCGGGLEVNEGANGKVCSTRITDIERLDIPTVAEGQVHVVSDPDFIARMRRRTRRAFGVDPFVDPRSEEESGREEAKDPGSPAMAAAAAAFARLTRKDNTAYPLGGAMRGGEGCLRENPIYGSE